MVNFGSRTQKSLLIFTRVIFGERWEWYWNSSDSQLFEDSCSGREQTDGVRATEEYGTKKGLF